MGSKSDAAWRTAARLAELAAQAYRRQRDAWITLANRCEVFILPDVTDK